MKSHEPPKEHICPFCKRQYKWRSDLKRHEETCKMRRKIQRLLDPKFKKNSKKEDISENEQIEKNQKICEKKVKKEEKELPVWIMKNKKTDTSQIIVDISAKVHFA